jgi:predicted phage terminase large subunit-like protein
VTAAAPPAPTQADYERARDAARELLTAYGILIDPVPNWQPYAFHRRVLEALEWVERTPDARLIIEGPPRVGKTVGTGWLLPTWFLGRHPEQEVIAATYATSRAEDIGRRVRQIMGSGKYRVIFPEARPLEQYRAATRIDLAAGGAYRGVSFDGTITGLGGDLILIDDAVKGLEQARSALWQSHLRETYQFVLRPRVKPGGKIVVSMHRWARDDFVGWLRAQGEDDWRVLSCPMLDAADAPLVPEMFDRAACERIRHDVGERAWRSLYQQDPAPDDVAVFQRSWWKFHGGERDEPTPRDFDRLILFWDTKLKDTVTSGSFVCGQAWGRLGARFYLLARLRGRWGFAETLRQIQALAARFPEATEIGVEDAAAGPAAIEVLRRKFPNVVPVPARGSKIARAEAIAPVVEAGSCYLPREPWTDEFVEELASFPGGAHDDQVDAAVHALARLSRTEDSIDDLVAPMIDLTQESWSMR